MDESLINNYTQTDILSSDQPENKMPQNIEAEQSLIGSILFDNKVLEDLPSNFDTRYFFDPLHASIYEACISLTDNGRLADPLTLKNYLNDTKL